MPGHRGAHRELGGRRVAPVHGVGYHVGLVLCLGNVHYATDLPTVDISITESHPPCGVNRNSLVPNGDADPGPHLPVTVVGVHKQVRCRGRYHSPFVQVVLNMSPRHPHLHPVDETAPPVVQLGHAGGAPVEIVPINARLVGCRRGRDHTGQASAVDVSVGEYQGGSSVLRDGFVNNLVGYTFSHLASVIGAEYHQVGSSSW
mmetsp:Transcript_19746/g.50079  ORF Transcript_19746/g.50079 Transcript_19746/m.50079 type:complete len:202 (-) Transcript_19746:1337-1942(-)